MPDWSNQPLNLASFSKQAKSSADFSSQAKSDATFSKQTTESGLFYLLQEISDYLLQENGYRILLQESIDWAGLSKGSASFSKQAKS